MDAFDRFTSRVPNFKIHSETLQERKTADRLQFLLQDAEDLIAMGFLRHSWEYYDEHSHYMVVNPHLNLTIAFRPAYQAYNRWIAAKTRKRTWQEANPGVDRRLYRMPIMRKK